MMSCKNNLEDVVEESPAEEEDALLEQPAQLQLPAQIDVVFEELPEIEDERIPSPG
jgi:hypothetical protein